LDKNDAGSGEEPSPGTVAYATSTRRHTPAKSVRTRNFSYPPKRLKTIPDQLLQLRSCSFQIAREFRNNYSLAVAEMEGRLVFGGGLSRLRQDDRLSRFARSLDVL
jgi:hypothetical protein